MPKYKHVESIKFNNKWYHYWQSTTNKSGARSWAKSVREEGFLARIITRKGSDGKTYYLIYRRQK